MERKRDYPFITTGRASAGRYRLGPPSGQCVMTVVFLQVRVGLKGKRLEHQGIRVEFIGQIELFYDRGNNHDFLSLVKQLEPPREMAQDAVYDFDFHQVEKPHETYTGTNVRLRYSWEGGVCLVLTSICRYFLRVTIVRRLSDIVVEKDIAVHTLSQFPELNNR